jgi:hypothetical protein
MVADMNLDDDLKAKQEAGAAVERSMIDFLLQFQPARELKICDAQLIADHARRLAFDHFWGFGR